MSEEKNIPPEEIPQEQPENKESADETISSAESITEDEQPQTINNQPQTKDMETHAQHLHKAPGHGWKHYLFEFLMLFLAVTLGFFVENQREHFVENQREKEFIFSIAEDLKQDIYDLDSIIDTRTKKDVMMGSLLKLLKAPDIDVHGNEIYYLARWCPRTYRFYTHDRTILQLKNAGNWRLINNKKVSDALQSYDGYSRSLTVYIEEREETLVKILYPSLNKLFDAAVFESMLNGMSFSAPTNNPKLLSYDKMTINEFANQVHFLKNSNLYFLTVSKKLLEIAHQTRSLLKIEYDLEKYE